MRFQQNPLWIRSGSRRCLRVLCEAPLSPSELTGVGQLQLSTFGASSILLLKAAGTLNIRIQNRSLASSAPHRARYFSQTLGHVRGRLRPTLE